MTEAAAQLKITILEAKVEILEKENLELRQKVSNANWQKEYDREMKNLRGRSEAETYQGGA